MAYAEQVGFETIIERGEAAVASLGPDLVYAGFSLGVMPAQKLAMTRPAHVPRCSCTPPSRWSIRRPWPEARRGCRST